MSPYSHALTYNYNIFDRHEMKILPNGLVGGTLDVVETLGVGADSSGIEVVNCTGAEVVGRPVAMDFLFAAIL